MDITTEDKWDLIEALYQYGTDVETLKKALPGWSKSHLLATVNRYRIRARKVVTDVEEEEPGEEPPLKRWIDMTAKLHQLQGSTNQIKKRRGRKPRNRVHGDHMSLMSKVMMYAACFEEHYQGSGPEDPNYSEIYRYLAQLLEGKEPTQLSPGSAAKMLQMLDRLKQVVTDNNSQSHLYHLHFFPLPSSASKNYMANASAGGPVATSSSDNAEVSVCPLFEDTEEEVDDADLMPGDPYYEVKREKVMKKLESTQLESAAKLACIPGANPLEFQTRHMVKPAIYTVNTTHTEVIKESN
ncbi:uncharacterized protein LOC121867753 isoform X2 [Homarus americanus]|uniref:uncharacterized protein LOC121867753 isoform X2 n=1 Tax=Homarus americanus TaxID=6706 RepID=UPI001C4782C1|nr:uncharacterized protein LOC121867753 isoform X2 [Homarus americanus]